MKEENLGTIGSALSFFAEINIWQRKKKSGSGTERGSFDKYLEKNDVGKK
jgi:hypothetical protein